MTGMPIRVNSRLHSSLCCRVTLTVRRVKRSMSSVVPTKSQLTKGASSKQRSHQSL
jgi:hypothetical protein